MSAQKKLRRLIFSFLAGTLLAAAFPEFSLAGLAWLAPGIILCLAHHDSGKWVFLSGFLSGLGSWMVGVYWLLFIPFRWYGLAAYLGQSAVGAAYLGGWCWLCWHSWPARKTHRRSETSAKDLPQQWLAMTPWARLGWPLFCAIAWVATEMALGHILTGFPEFLGASQFRWLALIQVSSFTGVYGVSFIVSWLSISLYCTILSGFAARKRLPLVLRQILPPLLVLTGVLAYGRHELSKTGDAPRQLKIALVQPAIPQPAIWDPSEETNRFLKLLEISRLALAEKPDLLVWPEASLPEMITRDQFTQDAVVNLLRPYHAWMVMGASDFENQPGAAKPSATEWFNSAFLINPAGEMVARYHKRHLVPFGEFMPGARWFPFLSRLRAAGAGLSSGTGPGLFQIAGPPARFSVLICYEDIFPNEVRAGQDDETDYLLNLTNDGWFGNSSAQWLHMICALFRAVELHLPLVRCCNNGITCWIDNRGRLHNVYFPGSKNVYQAGFKIIEVPLASSDPVSRPTFYRQHGDFFGWGCVALTTVVTLTRLNLRRGGKSATTGKAPRPGSRPLVKTARRSVR
ncbi:MAG: apolipoprotein N-acyltransferase [Verrucomicrobiota bacterium]